MKKTFLVRRNALLSSTNISWGTFTLVGVLCVLVVRIIAPNFFWYAFTPVFRSADAFTNVGHVFFSSFGTSATLTLQNEKLIQENTALANENQALLQKAGSLEALLDSSASGRVTKGIIASVIARPPASPYDTFVLSLGKNADVALGQEVFGPGGVPLGVVSSVLDDFSRVTLFSAPKMVTNGWIGSTHIPLVMYGAGAGVMRASFSRSAGIAVGDEVFVSGPGLLPIGTVVRIESDSSSPAVTLQIEPALNLFSVTWVELRDTGAAFTDSLSWATSTPL